MSDGSLYIIERRRKLLFVQFRVILLKLECAYQSPGDLADILILNQQDLNGPTVAFLTNPTVRLRLLAHGPTSGRKVVVYSFLYLLLKLPVDVKRTHKNCIFNLVLLHANLFSNHIISINSCNRFPWAVYPALCWTVENVGIRISPSSLCWENQTQ